MELVVCALGILNVTIAIFNKKAKTENRLFSLFAGLFALGVWFIMVAK